MNLSGEIGIILGLLSIGIAVYIAWRQHKQMDQQKEQIEELTKISEATKKIGQETHHTAQKLKSDTYIREVIDRFFSVQKEENHIYKCVFPVYYDKKPLPYIVVGDYHALHVIQTLMGTDRIELAPVCIPAKDSLQEANYSIDTNVIYLCTPQANQELKYFAPPIDPLSKEPPIFKFKNNIELPCWFTGELDKKAILIYDNRRLLPSPAEPDYAVASKLPEGQAYRPSTNITTDYAILLRLTVEGKKVIVVAGIHQYGTWIAGDFFRRLTTGEFSVYDHIFLSDEDFMAILWGEFNTKTFSVSRCNILEELIWLRKESGWERILPNSKENTGALTNKSNVHGISVA